MSGVVARWRTDAALRFAVMAAVVLSIVCAAAFWFIDRRFEAVLDARDAETAALELRLLTELDRDEGRAALVRAVGRRVDAFADTSVLYAVVDRGGAALAGSIAYPPDFVADGRWRALHDAHGAVQGFARAQRLQDGAIVLTGVDLEDRAAARSALTQAFFIAIAAVLAAALGVGVLLNRLVLERIDKVVATSARIMAGDLDERVPRDGRAGEFDRLAASLNAMLDRIAALITQMRAVTDAMAHDLRLPLQRVKSGLERAVAHDDPAKQRAAIEAAMGEADDALSTFDLLLEIARAQSGVGRESFTTIDAADLVGDVGEIFEPLAEEKGLALTIAAAPLTLSGQSVLLRQALGNLLHNAIKYTPAGGHVRIGVTATAAEVVFSVEDDGPGVPEDRLGDVVQPFGRLARDAAQDGKGLGLAVAAACAKLHGGRLELRNLHPGLHVALSLPRT